MMMLRSRVIRLFLAVFFFTLVGAQGFAQSKGISFQAYIKSPSGTAVSATGLTVNAKILSSNKCILREETFSNVDIVNGYLNLTITKGIVGGADKGFSIQKVFDNRAAVITDLTCLNSDGSVNGSVTSYTPTSSDIRKLRISTSVNGDTIVADFNLRSVPFATNSETVNGKLDTDFVNINSSQNLTQANIESIFNRFTKLDAILNSYNSGGTAAGINITGNAATATTATNVSGTVAIANGGTGATSASAARTNLGLGNISTISLPSPVDATKVLKGDGTWGSVAGAGSLPACNNDEILKYTNGTGWVCSSISGSGAVTSVSAALTAGNPITVSGTSAPTVDISVATSSQNGYLSSSDWSTFNSKQASSTELSGLVTGMVSTGIVQRTGAGAYTSLGTTAPINVTGGNIGISIGSGLTSNAGSLVPDFATTNTAGKVVEANDARLPSSTCVAGNKMRWSGSAWVCETDYADPSGSGVVAVANGGTGTSSGSITGTGALTFTAGGTDTNINLAPNGNGTVDVASKRITSVGTPIAAADAATKAYVDAASGGSSHGEVCYSTAGSYTFTPPSGVTSVELILVGGGGGGGGGSSNNNIANYGGAGGNAGKYGVAGQNTAEFSGGAYGTVYSGWGAGGSGGGGGGGWTNNGAGGLGGGGGGAGQLKVYTNVSVSGSVTVVVGAGGIGGAAGDNTNGGNGGNGTDGGNTCFGSKCANGGAGGVGATKPAACSWCASAGGPGYAGGGSWGSSQNTSISTITKTGIVGLFPCDLVSPSANTGNGTGLVVVRW